MYDSCIKRLGECTEKLLFCVQRQKYDTVKWSILNDRVIQFSNQKEPVSSSVVFAGVRYIDINCAKLLIVLNNGDKYLAYKYAKRT